MSDRVVFFDAEQLLRDIHMIASGGMPFEKAFESLPVGKYVKLATLIAAPSVDSDAADVARVESDVGGSEGAD
jgi:hypothetical protein